MVEATEPGQGREAPWLELVVKVGREREEGGHAKVWPELLGPR
jgi:hypothetical protein